MDRRIKLIEALKIQLGGLIYINYKEKEGEESMQHYLFKCPMHGVVENYITSRTNKQLLICPYCEVMEKRINTQVASSRGF
jgi:hypothetical protein